MTDEIDAEEHEWRYAVKQAGTSGLAWALVALLIRKRVFTIDEYRDALFSEVGRQAAIRK